jgi:hypothetical protein
VCECLDEACRLILQAILEHLEVEYFKSECQIPAVLKILTLFSDLQYSTVKCSKSACKVFKNFPAGRCEDLCVNA